MQTRVLMLVLSTFAASALDSVPPAVKAGFERRAGGRKIVLVESITTGPGIVAYEAHIKSFLRTIQVKLAPDGSPAK